MARSMEEGGIGVARARERRGVAECTTEREKEERKKRENDRWASFGGS